MTVDYVTQAGTRGDHTVSERRSSLSPDTPWKHGVLVIRAQPIWLLGDLTLNPGWSVTHSITRHWPPLRPASDLI